MENNIVKLNDLCSCGFDTLSKKTLGTIMLPIKVGLLVFPTTIHIISRPNCIILSLADHEFMT
jgi:hypothetical protein